jgi:hypothetical protein
VNWCGREGESTLQKERLAYASIAIPTCTTHPSCLQRKSTYPCIHHDSLHVQQRAAVHSRSASSPDPTTTGRKKYLFSVYCLCSVVPRAVSGGRRPAVCYPLRTVQGSHGTQRALGLLVVLGVLRAWVQYISLAPPFCRPSMTVRALVARVERSVCWWFFLASFGPGCTMYYFFYLSPTLQEISRALVAFFACLVC